MKPMMSRKPSPGLLLIVLFLGAVVRLDSALAERDRRGSFEYQGRTREYLVHLPPAASGDTALPLVLSLHGGGGDADNQARTSGLNITADRAGFIVVYPEGITRFRHHLRTWNAGNCCGYALTEKVDDVGFIRALLARLANEVRYDRHRVYATGLSNGGMMAYRLACEMTDQLAAIAPVAGALNVAECRPTVPMPVMIFHGTADQHVLYEGGQPRRQADWSHPRTDRSVEQARDFWVTYNRCTTPPKTTTVGHVVRQAYTDCAADSEVEVVTILGGGHAWPGGLAGWRGGDPPTREISANDLMWEFFRRHRR